jgi:hypothetical protein
LRRRENDSSKQSAEGSDARWFCCTPTVAEIDPSIKCQQSVGRRCICDIDARMTANFPETSTFEKETVNLIASSVEGLHYAAVHRIEAVNVRSPNERGLIIVSRPGFRILPRDFPTA